MHGARNDMKLIYIDESGDPGAAVGSSPYYILSGIIVDASDWKEFFNQFEDFRRQIYQKFGADYGEFKGSEIFMHQGGAYQLQLDPVEVQWVYDNLIKLIFDNKVSRILVAQSKEVFRAHYPSGKQKTLTKDLRLLTWNAFLTKFEHYLIDASSEGSGRVTGLVYFDGKHDPHIYKIVNRYARRYDQEQPYAGAGIIESPVFVDSKASKLIQLADVLAYSTNYLLREQNPIESVVRINQEISQRIFDEVESPLK